MRNWLSKNGKGLFGFLMLGIHIISMFLLVGSVGEYSKVSTQEIIILLIIYVSTFYVLHIWYVRINKYGHF